MLGFLSPEGHPGEVRWPVFSEEAMGGASWTLNLVGLAWHPHWDLLGWCGQWREDTDFVPTVGPGMPVAPHTPQLKFRAEKDHAQNR